MYVYGTIFNERYCLCTVQTSAESVEFLHKYDVKSDVLVKIPHRRVLIHQR
jgi:hypothetical protein